MPQSGSGTRYREIRQLGAGGMGVVSLAEDTVLNRLVALKRVPGRGDPRDALRLKREALVGASLNHPNLVYVYDAELRDDGEVVIVMEYIEGQTLADLIRSGAPLPPAGALRVLRGVGAGLDAIHERGIVHRDVKPANVLLGLDGAVKLADLGVADVADRTRITSADAVVGSFSYMSPEQLNGATPAPPMDVYALSAVAYEMLTGQKARPQSNPLALAHAISTQPPPDLLEALPSAPRSAGEVLQRGMSADPAQRPQSAGDLVRRLEGAFSPERSTVTAPIADAPKPSPKRPATVLGRPPRLGETSSRDRGAQIRGARRRRTSMLAPILAAAALLAVAGGVVAAILSGGAPKRSGTHTSLANRSHSGASRHQSSGSAATHGSTTSSTSHSSSPTTTPAQAAGSGGTSSTTQSTTAGSSSTEASSGSSSTGGASSGSSSTGETPAATPVSIVQGFYTAAAGHDYAKAWSLADTSMHSQLGGYAAFRNQMSAVRSITFRQARQISGGSSSATVALQTISVRRDGTEQCAGTARTVRSSDTWLLDGISISCS